jgi:hypothetical protein
MKLKPGSWKVSVVNDDGCRKLITVHDEHGRNHKRFQVPLRVRVGEGDLVSVPLEVAS